MIAEYYSAAVHSTATAGAVYSALMAGATKSIALKKIHINARSGVGTNVGVTRSYQVGTATSIATGAPHRTGAAPATARVETAWSSAPTGTRLFFADRVIQGTQGEQLTIWESASDGEIVLEPGTAILLINVGTGTGAELAIEWSWQEGPI